MKFPIGESNFETIRKNGMFYIDKSYFIEELCEDRGPVAFLFDRPIHFGKTLNMSMLSSFFDITKDSKELFEGLAIAKNKAICDEWMNKYPTIFVSFESVDGNCFDEALEKMSLIIKELYSRYRFLLDSDKIDDAFKIHFNRYLNEKLSIVDIECSLGFLIEILHEYYEKDVILLVDDYDAPLAKAILHGYYKEMHYAIYGTLVILKDNPELEFGVLTGCLRIVNYSYFDTLNNVYHRTINDYGYNDCFGFKEDEVEKALKSLGLEDKMQEFKEWYGGYCVKKEPLYCSSSVIGYLNDLDNEKDAKPKVYWKDPCGEQFIKSLFTGNERMMEDISYLLDGGCCYKMVNEIIRYDMVSEFNENIWTYLMMTGYLAIVNEDESRHNFFGDGYTLKIPNKEMISVFKDVLLK